MMRCFMAQVGLFFTCFYLVESHHIPLYASSLTSFPGWNDPPALAMGVSDSAASSRRLRPRVFHSVDGVGAADSSVVGGVYSDFGSIPQILPQGPLLSGGQPFVPQTSLHVPMMPQQQQQQQQQLPPPQSSLNYDNTSALSRLSDQVNKVLGDPSLEIPGKDSILASISSLHLDISLNRLSAGASELVKQFISFLEVKDFKQAEDTLNVIKQQSEMVNWAMALHYLMYYAHLQALRR
ncbi:hypothetical protein TSMEX_002864 [Taenia solium]|eukprot:TsM_000281800 transcript=TsM_000281800 gene=TsM_000281800